MQLIYDYVETDDDNDDEIDGNLSSISRTRVILHQIPHRPLYEIDGPLLSHYVHTGWNA